MRFTIVTIAILAMSLAAYAVKLPVARAVVQNLPDVHKRHSSHLESQSTSLCPAGLTACPIPGQSANDYECINTATELESCGGCASLGSGQDCTAIPGVLNVKCKQGSCAGMCYLITDLLPSSFKSSFSSVSTCLSGFKRAQDGRSCIPL